MNNFWTGFEKQAAFNPFRRFKALKRLERMRTSSGAKNTATIASPIKKHQEAYNRPGQKALRIAGKGILGLTAAGAGMHYLTRPLKQKNVGYNELHRSQRYAR